MRSTISPSTSPDLDCDYYGVSLHKWTGAPVGTGFLYVRKSRIASTWSLMASSATQADDIRKFEEIGTHPAANHNAISAALIFNEGIGIDRKAARLRYLRDRWAHRLAQNQEVQDAAQRRPGAILRYRLSGLQRRGPGEDARDPDRQIFNIYTAFVPHEEYTGLRITPHIYTTLQEIDTFSAAVEKEVG